MKHQQFKNILLLNFAMLIVSTSGALGKFINLPPPLIIWYRVFIALIFLGLYCRWRGYSFSFDVKKHGFTIFLSGVFLTINFVAYFTALKWSNVTVAMLSLFTFPIMTTLLEPLFFKTKFQITHLFLGLMVLLGIYFLTPTFDVNNDITQGLLMGLLAALAWAIRNLILKSHIVNFNSSVLMIYQMAIAMVLLFPALFFYNTEGTISQLPYLLFLGLITTAIGHTLFLNSFNHFSVSTASIMASVQPIFGIIIAMIFLNEIPTGRSLIGGGLILLTVMVENWRAVNEL